MYVKTSVIDQRDMAVGEGAGLKVQNQVQYHFSTQQNVPNTILPLSEFSYGFKEQKFPYKLAVAIR